MSRLPGTGGRSRPARHLGEDVRDYLDRTLPPAQQLWADQHLLVCDMCRAEVADEGRLVAQLRGLRTDPGRHRNLVTDLLEVAHQEAAAAVPVPASARRGVGLIGADAPPQYQSARRSLACAALAVACCLGAAVVVITVPHGSSDVPSRAPIGQAPVPTAHPATAVPAGLMVPSVQSVRSGPATRLPSSPPAGTGPAGR